MEGPSQTQETNDSRPATSVEEEPHKKTSAAAKMRKGQEIAATSLDRKTPTAGDMAANAFITWSSPKSGGRWRNFASATRQDFAVILGNCWGELVDAGGATNPPSPEIAVSQENRNDGRIHYHAILGAPRNKLWRHLPTLLRDRQNRNRGRRQTLG